MNTENAPAAPQAPPSAVDLLDVTIVTVAAPSIAADLDAGEAQLQWMLAAYTLALGSGLITGGRVGDDHGRRRVFLVSLAGFALASAACALAPSPGVLIAMRVVQGLAGGFMVPQVFGIIRSSFDPAGMARALGAYGAVQGLAAVAGPLLGGALVDADLWGLSWRTIFWVNVPVAVVALAVGARVLPEPVAERRARLDVPGAVLSALGVALILLPVVQGRAVFAGYERRLAARGGQPVFAPELLRVKTFTAGLAASVLFFGAIGSFFLVLSLYLQTGTGRSVWDTGLVLLPYAIGAIITSGVGVNLAAKAGRALLVTGSLALAASQGVIWILVRDGGRRATGRWPRRCSSAGSGSAWAPRSWSTSSSRACPAGTPARPAESCPRSTRSATPSASPHWAPSSSTRSRPGTRRRRRPATPWPPSCRCRSPPIWGPHY
ncbi:MFS transporter [Actinomadura darangshiensis]|uniref:MFS transporter n=1 Tax=Actinomadura darangshiensis TaxID=705336 RepID=UPI001FB64A68|nr:MFS transporter [Actinomadura darangshiensis]